MGIDGAPRSSLANVFPDRRGVLCEVWLEYMWRGHSCPRSCELGALNRKGREAPPSTQRKLFEYAERNLRATRLSIPLSGSSARLCRSSFDYREENMLPPRARVARPVRSPDGDGPALSRRKAASRQHSSDHCFATNK